MPVREIPDYRLKGHSPERVWAVPLREVDGVLGTDAATRRRHLRGLRDLGFLRCQPGRLTAKVRERPAVKGDSGIRRVYLFTVPPAQLPRKKRQPERRRPRQRIGYW